MSPQSPPTRTRVYLPATLATLATAYVSGGFGAGYAAHAVTGAVREWYIEGDLEELEYAALSEAADASLRLLAGELAAEARYEYRRVVIAADVAAECVQPVTDASPGRARSAIRLSCTVPLRAMVSVHVDEDAPAVRSAVADAIAALPAADAGDDDAAFVLDEARSHELLWFDVTEIPDVI
ncbi:MAG: hypothetical protein IPJ14_01795 [Kineosporiaceae bacterium]|nr:hypothetical protein [Kineosporiaceae bacterium]